MTPKNEAHGYTLEELNEGESLWLVDEDPDNDLQDSEDFGHNFEQPY